MPDLDGGHVPPAAERWAYLPEFASETLPRYTSYPPANRFTTDVNAATVEAAISRLPTDATLSLYVHIPFCRQLCWYCGCHTSVPTRADPVDFYISALIKEIGLVAAHVPAGAVVRHLHFGGGSPDSLEPVEIDAIFEALKSSFRFAPDAEIAAEMDPRGATAAVVDAFARGGLNRASFGLQDVNLDVQRRINRIQPSPLVETAVERLRQAGVASLNLDIMYGLPGQNEAHAAKTAAFAASLGADRIAAFGYAHVPWFKKHQNAIKTADLAQGEERFRQAERVARTLIDAGYSPVGFDHFARPGDSLAVAARSGTLRRNFQGYTTDVSDALIGLGASAISSLPDLHYQNAPSTADYRTTVGDGALPVVRGAMLREEDRHIAGLIENLLCRFEAELPDTLDGATMARLERLQAAGLATVGNGRVRITPMGRTYARNVAASFDPGFYATTAARHSVAV